MIDPNASDWSDLDLLTMGEAKERLTQEITVVEREIAELEQVNDKQDLSAGGKLAALRHRLDALRERMAG